MRTRKRGAGLHRLSWELFLFAEEVLWDDYERDAFINKTN